MKRVCAWCKKTLPDVEPFDDDRTTHGMCEECGKRIKEETKELGEMKIIKNPDWYLR